MAAALVLAGGGVFWLAPGPVSDDGMGRADVSDWTLPVLPLREAPEQAYQRLKQSQPWGKSAAPVAAGGAKTTNWRLRGIAHVGNGRIYALVEEDGGKVRRYQVGEPLPHGEKLLAIHADRIEIETPEAGRRTLALYQPVEAPPARGKPRSGNSTAIPALDQPAEGPARGKPRGGNSAAMPAMNRPLEAPAAGSKSKN